MKHREDAAKNVSQMTLPSLHSLSCSCDQLIKLIDVYYDASKRARLVDVNKNIFVLTNSRVYANTSALRYRIEGIFILHVPNGVEL